MKRGGSIVHVTSTLARRAAPSTLAHAISKASPEASVRGVRVEDSERLIVSTSAGEVSAKYVVDASGWSAVAASSLDSRVEPRKEGILLLDNPQPVQHGVLRQLVNGLRLPGVHQVGQLIQSPQQGFDFGGLVFDHRFSGFIRFMESRNVLVV